MVDLDVLADFLSSEHAPEGCMDLSELDGFLAGLIAGPTQLDPTEWLPLVWDGDDPMFADAREATRVMDTIAARYQEILGGLDATPPDYAPVFWADVAGTTITEDWAVGFMQAVSLDPPAWAPLLGSDDTAGLLIPIAALAGMALPADSGAELPVPDAMLDRLLEQGETVLPDCVVGLRLFWRRRGVAPRPWPAALSQRRH